MKLKLVIHRLRPVIGFEHSQLSLPRAELNACSQLVPNTGRAVCCLARPGVPGPLSPALPFQNLHTWKAKKETCFLPAPHTYQLASRTGRHSSVGKMAEWCQSRWCADGEGNTFYHRRWRRGGEDLKGEGRGSHVMPSSSTAEPPTNANPQSVLCDNAAKSLRDSRWLPQEGRQQKRGASLIFPKTPLTPPSPLFPDFCGPTDLLYLSM